MSVAQQSSITHSRMKQTRIFSACSVYGGAGGFGTGISQSTRFCSAGPPMWCGDSYVIRDGKLTMKNLNERLAAYMETVRSLEDKGKELKLNIDEFCEKKIVSRNLEGYFATISDLRGEIKRCSSENHRLVLQIENSKLATEDFKIRFEMELNLRTAVEADVLRLRGIRDNLTVAISNLEMSVEGLKEELVIMRQNHKKELHELQIQKKDPLVIEETDAVDSNLKQVLEDMREQYERLVKNNKADIERWYNSKMEDLQKQIVISKTEVKTFYKQLAELKRTYQSLEINQQSICAEVHCLQQNLSEVNDQYAVKLHRHQEVITTLEKQLEKLKVSLKEVQVEYSTLLELKPRLEMEIAEYRRLLGEEQCEEKKTVVITKVMTQRQEEQKPHIEKRVKTIVEQVVDGKVVSSSVDTQVESIQ